MTRRLGAGPKVRRVSAVRRIVQPPATDPWSDPAIVAVAIVMLVALILLSSVVPLTPPVKP